MKSEPELLLSSPSRIRSVVQLTAAHHGKIYFSGPLVYCVLRQPNGQKPTKDGVWTEVWALLQGNDLCIWDMKQTQEASQQGKEAPPVYINTADALIHTLRSVTVPETLESPVKRYPNVVTLNTAGSNLLLFSCPSPAALLSWVTAFRLSTWEKSRLEEIYTAHLLRSSLAHDHPSTLQDGRKEGWVHIRIAGQTGWRKVWMAIAAAADTSPRNKKRMSSRFRSKDSGGSLPSKPIIAIFAGPKPKDRKKPLLTFHDITQAFAVYPERPDLISRSTLIKLEGLIGDEETAGDMKGREGWLWIMPECEGGVGLTKEMLMWIVALHDAFQLYGRPQSWSWDPSDPTSLMFAYPVDPHLDLLFLQREQAETLDIGDNHVSSIRARLSNLLLEQTSNVFTDAKTGQPQPKQPPPPPAYGTTRDSTLLVSLHDTQGTAQRSVSEGSHSGWPPSYLTVDEDRGDAPERASQRVETFATPML
ncbi:hypothetical protein C8F04DRAFT_732160 [Mycena alexandri]|uniref:PH domain-containing protein n=1 Tax=Mycena alexandri TaxID=1745969 RepID=A0AAD6SPX3_9AGAR|nr:hypothetical protein C8F04DRAFT_732160 [Mycena alexandri]